MLFDDQFNFNKNFTPLCRKFLSKLKALVMTGFYKKMI